jgi:hypothetical protein
MMTVTKRIPRVKPDVELIKLADSLLTNYKKPEDMIVIVGDRPLTVSRTTDSQANVRNFKKDNYETSC